VKAVLDHTALNRWGRPAELAGAFQYPGSDAAEFVTGTVLNVDGVTFSRDGTVPGTNPVPEGTPRQKGRL